MSSEEHSESDPNIETPKVPKKTPSSPTTRIFLRGLAISLPPILTLVILLWIAGAVYRYMISPVSTSVQYVLSQFVDHSRSTAGLVSWDRLPPLDYVGREYLITPKYQEELERRLSRQIDSQLKERGEIPKHWIISGPGAETEADAVFVAYDQYAVPYNDHRTVAASVRPEKRPVTKTTLYMELVTHRYFKSQFLLSTVAVLCTIIGVYFLGRFVTARLGAWAVHKVETGIFGRLPLVSNVYSSVKQVTDFLFTERTVEYNRVVALEYPRRGLWSIGFVTGDALLEVTTAAGEPLLSVLMPTSPMPMTGFTICVRRSEVIDLNITIDQAFQYCLSCGVLVPSHQKVTPERLQEELTKRLTSAISPPVVSPMELPVSQQEKPGSAPPQQIADEENSPADSSSPPDPSSKDDSAS